MNDVREVAQNASTILMTERNMARSLYWLGSIGLGVPDFPRRCYFQRAANGVEYGVVGNEEMAAELQAEGTFGLMGADAYGELPPEAAINFSPVSRLDCRLALFLPEAAEWDGREPLSVATSNPRSLIRFAVRRGIPLANIVTKPGKIEFYPASGRTQAGFDIVETGDTARNNRLRIVARDALLTFGGVWRGDAA